MIATSWWLDHAEIAVYSSPYGWVVGVCLTWLLARRKVIPAWRRLHERQAHIEDQLDTSTPGGLTDVVERLAALERTTTEGLVAGRAKDQRAQA